MNNSLVQNPSAPIGSNAAPTAIRYSDRSASCSRLLSSDFTRHADSIFYRSTLCILGTLSTANAVILNWPWRGRELRYNTRRNDTQACGAVVAPRVREKHNPSDLARTVSSHGSVKLPAPSCKLAHLVRSTWTSRHRRPCRRTNPLEGCAERTARTRRTRFDAHKCSVPLSLPHGGTMPCRCEETFATTRERGEHLDLGTLRNLSAP